MADGYNGSEAAPLQQYSSRNTIWSQGVAWTLDYHDQTSPENRPTSTLCLTYMIPGFITLLRKALDRGQAVTGRSSSQPSTGVQCHVPFGKLDSCAR